MFKRDKKGYWDRNDEDENIEDDHTPKIVSIDRYKVIGHTIEFFGDNEFSSYVAYNYEGEIDHAILDDDAKLPVGLESIVGSYVEITIYDDEDYTARIV